MKQCNEPNCTLPVFGGLKCKYHQHKRTDKPDKTIINPVKPRSFKKGTNTKDEENNGFKSSICYQWGFTTQKELFEFVWLNREHKCQISGSNLDLVPENRRHWTMAHIIPKGLYPMFKLNPDNILLVSPEVHQLVDNFTEDMREKHKEIDFNKWFSLVEQKKQEYKQFLKDNQL